MEVSFYFDSLLHLVQQSNNYISLNNLISKELNTLLSLPMKLLLLKFDNVTHTNGIDLEVKVRWLTSYFTLAEIKVK